MLARVLLPAVYQVTDFGQIFGHSMSMLSENTVTTHSATVKQWTAALGQATGAPGGGAASGVMLAIAASLMSMVAGYTETDDTNRSGLEQLRKRVDSLRLLALRQADEDAQASDNLGRAFRRSHKSPNKDDLKQATLQAARASSRIGEQALDAISDLEWLAFYGNRSLVADVVVALGALRAALTGARTNVSVDVASYDLNVDSSSGVEAERRRLVARVQEIGDGIVRLDALLRSIDHPALPQ